MPRVVYIAATQSPSRYREHIRDMRRVGIVLCLISAAVSVTLLSWLASALV